MEWIALTVSPTAAELYRGNLAFGVGEELAVVEALASVDERAGEIRKLLRTVVR